MGLVKEFFDQLEKITDVLNVGRLLFYTFAGALVVVPAYMILWRLMHPAAPLTEMEISTALGAALFVSSIVVGFVIATAAFPLLLEGLRGEVEAGMEKEAAGGADYSFAGNYRTLKNKESEDWAAWLISEYYRYVEIAVYVPVGAIIGLALIEIYLLLDLWYGISRPENAGLNATHGLFALGFIALVLIRVWLWPDVWTKRVVAPTIRTYLLAKKRLIDAVKADPPAGPHPDPKPRPQEGSA